MKLLEYMSKKAAQASQIIDETDFNKFVSAADREIRSALNLNKGAINLPEDFAAVVTWLGGSSCSVLREIDVLEGGVFYYYLCREGLIL